MDAYVCKYALCPRHWRRTPGSHKTAAPRDRYCLRAEESDLRRAAMAEEPPTDTVATQQQHITAICDDGLVREGMVVILETNGETSSFVRVRKDGEVKLAKKLVSMEPLVGARFGTLFELAWSEGKPYLQPNKIRSSTTGAREDVEKEKATDSAAGLPKMKAADYADVEGGSNKTFFDDNTAQKLDDKAIWELRDQGVEGSKIVEALIANSATFSEKSAFAQEKYRKKMMKRHTVKYVSNTAHKANPS